MLINQTKLDKLMQIDFLVGERGGGLHSLFKSITCTCAVVTVIPTSQEKCSHVNHMFNMPVIGLIC